MAAGILWAFMMFFLGLGALFFDWGSILVSVLGSIYIGYSTSAAGIAVGVVWGFIDGFVCGAVFAWIYNYIGNRQ